MELSLPQYDGQDAAQFIYTLADTYFAYLEQEGEAALEQLSDEQLDQVSGGTACEACH